MTDSRILYQSLLAEVDAEAREDYSYDPSVKNFLGYDTSEHVEVQPHVELEKTTVETEGEESMPVQDQPAMREVKRVVIIDAAMRDWTIQPDSYSNVFTFGTKAFLNYGNAQIPYFFNNPTIPLSAYETPTVALNTGVAPGLTGDIQNIPNNRPQPFPPGVEMPGYFYDKDSNLVHPAYGWKIVISNGNILHTPMSFSYTDPNVQVFFYPIYEAKKPRGAQIGIDIQPKRYGVTGYSFYTETVLSNITKIKISHATLPVYAAQTYKPSIFAGRIQYPDALQDKPYIYMSIDSLKAGYYGGAGTVVQKAFSVLVQNNRNLYEGQSVYPAEYVDYAPWSDESYEFDPPLSKLSNANIQLYTPMDQQISHLDNLSIVDAVLLGDSSLGMVRFFVTQNYNKTTSGFGVSNLFGLNEIRVGDELTFYYPSLTQIQGDPSASDALKSFIGLMSNGFLITETSSVDFSMTGILPTAAYGTSFTAVPKVVSNLPGMITTYNTMSSLYNTLSQICFQQYTDVTQTSLSFAQARTFSKDYVIPIMNINIQPRYAFEITTLEPDTKKLQKIIPN
jgi:hypothetical protein